MKMKICTAIIIFLVLAGNISAQNIFDIIRTGNLDSVKILIEQKPELVNTTTKVWRDTPLHIAVEIDNLEIASYLIAKGASIDPKNKVNATPLHSSSYFNRKGDIAKLLIENGADVNAVDDFQTSILMQSSIWNPIVANHLLDHNVNIPSYKEDDGKELFMNSAQNNLLRLFNQFIAMGADIYVQDGSGNSLLHKAAAGGSLEIVKMLLEAKLSISMKNLYGWTPLHFATYNGHKETVALLIKSNADINARTISGQTAYNLAFELKNEEVTNLLSSEGAVLIKPKFPVLREKYFNQHPPGKVAKQFAIGIVASNYNHHGNITFSLDGKEAYWSVIDYGKRKRRAIIGTSMENGRWIIPTLAFFSKVSVGDDVPFISPDGQKLFFTTWRPIEEGGELDKENIWVMDKTNNDWSEPYPLPDVVNSTENIHHQISVDLKGNLYFGASPEGGFGASDIYCSKYENGTYQTPVNLGPIINGAKNEGQPFIAPDGSYLIFNKYKEVGWSIFISYLKKDGNWIQPIDLIDIIGCSQKIQTPIVSRDGKYLFFHSADGNQPSKPYWIDAGFIKKLRINQKL